METVKCTMCRSTFDSKDASILTMSGFGNARYICPECARLLDTATLDRDYENIKSAMDTLSERMEIDVTDTSAVDAITEILGDAAERAEMIKNSTYDFSLDGEGGGESFDEIPEELLESEEDKALDEKEAKRNKILDKITSWVCGAVLAGSLLYVIIRMLL